MRDGRFAYEVVNGVPVVAAPEEIDITNAPQLRSALLEAAAHGRGTLVVDMTRTRFCDSSGLHTLLAAHKRAQAEGGELRLAISAAPVLRVFAITGIDRVIPHFPSVDQALAHRSAAGRTAINDLAARMLAANITGSSRSPALAGLTEKPADHAACASVARRAPGGPPKAEPGADAGPAAPQAPP